MSYALYFAIALSLAFDASDQGQVSFSKLRTFIDASEFLIDISQKDPAENYRVRIACISNCASPLYFEEEVGDTPLGTFRASDQSGLIFTTWVAGSSYKVRAYYISGKAIHIVLNQSSRRPIAVYDGGQSVDLYQSQRPNTSSAHKITFRWNGYKFGGE